MVPHLLAYFPYFEKMEVGLCYPHALCVFLLLNFEYLNQLGHAVA
jgi:hypothetical protein